MPESDACPDPTRLAAWADGVSSDGGAGEAIERHVAGCARCAGALEALTCRRLEGLDLRGLRPGDPGIEGAGSARVRRLIEGAMTGVAGSDRDPLPGFLAGLEPSTRPGSLGRFAGYEVEEPAGRGGMGVVFRCFDPTLQRRVAIKVLLHDGQTTDDDPGASRFLSEARAIAALRHEHVVEVYSAGREGGWPFLVMPFHEEGTLQQWIDRGDPVRVEDAVRIGIQLLRALEATHARGILHRDLKPSNVLLEHGLDHVRLADFGLAESVEDLRFGGGRVVAGTPSYMAPEQARGEALDGRCDLYALGAILHLLLAGQPPRVEAPEESARTSAAAAGAGADSTGFSGVPPGFRPVLERLLAPRVADRCPDARTAREALEGLLPDSDGGRGRRRRFRVGARRVGVLLAILLAVLGGLEGSGRTALVNALLCRWTGDGFYIRGRVGTYGELGRAAAACRGGETVVARFHGERATAPLRVGPRGLHVQAAAGFRPALVSTNTSEALILALGPLVLEGLTLLSRVDARDAGQLIAAEGIPVTLVHCRLVRLRATGDDVLVRAGRRVDPDQPLLIHKPLLALRPGGSADLRHCVFAGVGATGVGLRGKGTEPMRVECDQCLFAIHRGFALRPESGSRVELRCSNSAFASAAMIDLEDAAALDRLVVTWDRCLLDRTGGVLLRWNRGGDGAWLNRMIWAETNVVYAGSGDFAFERRRGAISSASDWRALVRLSEESHRTSLRPLFGEVQVRSSQRLEALDVDVAGLEEDTGLPPTFRPDTVGDGPAYDRFRVRSGRSAAGPSGETAAAGRSR